MGVRMVILQVVMGLVVAGVVVDMEVVMVPMGFTMVGEEVKMGLVGASMEGDGAMGLARSFAPASLPWLSRPPILPYRSTWGSLS